MGGGGGVIIIWGFWENTPSGVLQHKRKNERNSLHTQVGSFNIYIEDTIFIID